MSLEQVGDPAGRSVARSRWKLGRKKERLRQGRYVREGEGSEGSML